MLERSACARARPDQAKAAQPGDDTAAGANLPIIGLSSNAYYADESDYASRGEEVV